MPTQIDFSSYIQRYENELLKNVIPFWEEHGIDKEYGGYHDSLDRDGSLWDSDKWMWMQWRKVYMWATLYQSPYKKDRYLDYAKQGFEFLLSHGKSKDGNYYFGLNRRGEAIIAPHSIYSEAFAVMGAAALYKATNEEKYKIEANSAMAKYISRMDNPKGLWDKSMPARPSRLSHGVYMILANLGTVVKDCLASSDYDDKVAEAVDMVVKHFWSSKHKVLFENLNPDLSVDLESGDGRHINPGHGLESSWFILQYAERNKRPDLIPQVGTIIKGLLDFGWDKKYGGIYYFMDVLNKPKLELEWDMKLWWVHNEALVATIYAYRLTKDPEFLDWFQKLDAWSFEHFRDPQYGEWYGYLNRRGEPTHLLKGSKWKCFFHLPRALMVCIDQMKKLEI
ncbi:MAG: AGE family epimerase/isomerase [SAR324 cluster bacterium]|uniref:AGE family epimerase/isomerase n=1 Tax=SAR324 cluster bacterium TaxID=2024889 RepID=A0A7X9FR51_9DELT|nr:AGE family epimerase/isomerase [SAR324 cluster bacterium]